MNPGFGRRSLLGWSLGAALAGTAGAALPARSDAPRRWRVGFANITEDPTERLEGLGFTGVEVRASFAFAARGLPLEIVFFDNGGSHDKALANATAAIDQRLDLYIQYCADPSANAQIAARLNSAGIPVLAVNHPVPDAPLYGADNLQAGQIAGEALVKFALETWPNQPAVAVILGDVSNAATGAAARAAGIAAAIDQALPGLGHRRLDSAGSPGKAEGLLRRLAAEQAGAKLLVAALDDATALAAKAAVETASRSADTVIVSQGCDRSVHGGFNDKKEIDPQNRGSILLGSVGYFLDRYGYDVLPLALSLLGGDTLRPLTTTRHVLVTSANVFRIYPPNDMN